ncbi:type IV toxin-antitoxin system AbiEi family antitoxin domain-containing protein [Nocardioides hwasunensis]|uniref:Type IV toxin-antitoxin system AbiEi family antitoxin domain-containing protein n=1 Tax=Nocardioides hwasunensis TaxID=397258 RepID=A0ABR8MEA3_9ACTN|nr:type IV toxin-antitoxin system AbiEi family antitoxin domain-containing protein [Nocardioides hwasunensis]MBD3914441.1 type IV toxin-antitoxin system AbiEi family antitoxin domain-containing protein [Nocardioides hwasunensis]
MQTPPPPDLTDVVRLRHELVADGYTDHQLAMLVRSGLLHRVRRGAYVDAALWRRLSSEDRHRVLARAVLLRAHPLTALTHVSTIVELGVPVWNIPLDEVHTTRTDGKGGRREAGVVHHVGELSESEVRVVNGVRVGPAARSAVEVIATATPEAALVVANGLLHAKHISREELVAAATTMKHWPHTLSAHRVVAMADERLESVAETRTYFMCRTYRLPRPTPQVPVLDEHGREFARVDFAWPELGVFLEFDGRIKYERYRREGETLEAFLMREKKREERICQLTGWVCLRIGWADLERPVSTCTRIRNVLESNRRPIGA